VPEARLRRELGLRDLSLFCIACIAGARWIPAAAHVPGSIALWFLSAVLFAVPLAVAVAALTVKYPGAGGLYLWTRSDFGPWHGFLCFWTYWMGIAVWFPTAAIFYMNAGFYTLGTRYAHLGENRIYLLSVALAAIWIALGTNIVGLGVGKWTQNIGGTATWLLGAVLVAVGAVVWLRRGSAAPIQLIPSWDFGTLSFGAATVAYAMSGMEAAGSMGGEMHDPKRDLPRAAWIASAFAVLFYTLGTTAMQVIVPPEKVSALGGYGQVSEAAGTVLGAGWLSPLFAVMIMACGIGQFGGLGASVSRLPFVAGVDHLLPEAFSRIHPRWGTPYVSILALGLVGSFLLAAYQLGDTLRAAYDELVSLMLITGFLPYVYIFGSAWKAGRRWSAISGWAVTVLAIGCSVVPTAEITNVWLFEGKLAAGTLAVIASAWFVYRRFAVRARC
jgi:amino acid transporter